MTAMFKIFGRSFYDWADFMSTVTFYRCNPHAIPGIAQLLCKMGRHDYEFVAANGDYGILECFYCLRRKGSKRSFGDS